MTNLKNVRDALKKIECASVDSTILKGQALSELEAYIDKQTERNGDDSSQPI